MDYLEFYKERYYKEVERKNEITSSFSTPIGIISALVAALFYFLTLFDFSINIILSIIFIAIAALSVVLLGIAIYHLIIAFSNSHNGLRYAYLNNSDELENYHKELKNYCIESNAADTSDKEFNDYILNELIKSSSINQTNNDTKVFHRFICNKYMIFAFLAVCSLAFPFGVNFGIKKTLPNTQKVEIDSSLNINLQTKQNHVFIDSLLNKLNKMADEEKEKKIEKPIPPPTKMLTEGVEPKTETRTFSSQEKGKTKDDKKKD
jgi:hypothetical protein